MQPLSSTGAWAVYLSYSVFETEFALQLAADLRAAGCSVWCDRLSVVEGEPLHEQVKQAIRSSAVLVAVLSPAYLQARYARLEWEFAAKKGYPIIPVLAGSVASATVPPQLALPVPLDFTGWRTEATYASQLEQLLAALDQRGPEDVRAHPPSAIEASVIRLAARVEMHLAAAEIREMPGKADGIARLALRVPSPIKALWGKPEQVQVTAAGSTAGTPAAFSEALAANPRRILTGEPGSGKSAALERLALDAAQAFLAEPETAPLPLWATLADWDEDIPFAAFLNSEWALAGLSEEPLASWLEQKRLALFLDGLSEMGSVAAEKIADLAGWLSADEEGLAVTLACRARDFSALPDLALARLELLPLDKDSTARLVHAQLGQDEGDRFLSELAQSAAEREQEGVPDWTTTPAALNGLMALYRTAPQGKLPTTLGGMYKRMLPSVWLCKRIEQMPGWTPFMLVEAALASVAHGFLSEELPLSAAVEESWDAAGSEAPLRAALNAGLIEVYHGRLHFRSRLLLEYFAAAGATRHDLLGYLRSARVTTQGQRAAGPWDEVVLLMAGMTSSPDALIRDVAEIDPFLAADCLANGVKVAEPVYDSLYASLAWFARANDAGNQAAAAQALNTVAREPITSTLLDVMRGGHWQNRQTALKTLRYSEVPVPPGLLRALRGWNWTPQEALAQPVKDAGADAVALMLTVLDDDDWARRRGAAWALGVLGDKAAVPGLVLALGDEDSLVRREAVIALGKVRDTAALPALLDALADQELPVRRAAATSVIALGSVALAPLQERLAQATVSERAAMAEIIGGLASADAVSPLVALAEDADGSVRAAAVMALGKLARPEAIPALTARLDDTTQPANADEAICYLAAAALRAIGTPEAMAAVERWQSAKTPAAIAEARQEAEAVAGSDALLAQLVSADWAERRDAVSALALRGDRTYVPVIAESLHDEDSQVRWAAARGLGDFEDDPAAVDALIHALEDSDTLVSDEAVTSLVRIGAPAVPALITTLRSKDANVRAAAVDALGRIGDTTALKPLKKLTRDRAHADREGQTVGAMAGVAVARLSGKEPAAQGKKRSILSGDIKKPSVVETAELPAVEPVAEPLVKDAPEPEAPAPEEQPPAAPVQEPAEQPAEEPAPEPEPAPVIEEEQGSWAGLEGLIAALRNPEWEVRQNAAKQIRAEARSLRGLDDPAAISLLAEALRDEDHTVRWAVVGALAWLRDDSAIPMLLEAMHDKHFTVRLAVIRAFAEIGQPVIAPALIERLRDSHALVREKAAETLGELRVPAARESLDAALQDAEPFVRRAAAEALGLLPGPHEVSGLLRAFEDDDAFVRLAVAEALGKTGSAEAVPVLIQHLTDLGGVNWSADLGGDERDKERVCDKAATALETIGTAEAMRAVKQWRKKLDDLRRGQ